ncbi:MAG: hypothetical protein Q4B27_04850 [Candidatus Saccharibacteria bacterium]|nr:hypothetical protein [Candidatus Saccharibacteria bacterium]
MHVALGEGGALLRIQAGAVVLVGCLGAGEGAGPSELPDTGRHLPDEAHLDGGQQRAGVEGPAGQRDRRGGFLARQGLGPEGEVVACGVLHRRAPAGGGVDVPEVVVPPRPFDRAAVDAELPARLSCDMSRVGAGDGDEVQLAGHVGQPVVLHRAAPLALLDHDERGGLLIDDAAVHLRHIQHQRCLGVAPGHQTAVQQAQAGLLARGDRLHAAAQAGRHRSSPLQQAATTRRLRGEGEGCQQHTHQHFVLLTPALTQAVNGRDEAMTQPLKRVLQATP